MNTEQGPTTCPRHPKVETALRCASCGTLICPACLVQTPVGAKCRDCASQRGLSVFTLTPLRALAGAAAGLVAGAAAGFAVTFHSSLGLFTLFAAFFYGGFAGEVILRAAGRKLGLKMEILAAVSLSVGALGGRLLVAIVQISGNHVPAPPHGILDALLSLVQPSPIPLAALGIAVCAAVSRIRYL